MIAAIFKRLLQAVPTLLGVTILVFAFLALSGDPVKILLGPEATAEEEQNLRVEMSLDKPIVVRYFIWLGDALRGDLGKSWIKKDRFVMDELLLRLPATLELAVTTMFIATLVAMIVAIISARKPGGWFDTGARTAIFVFLAMPSFWLGIELAIIFSRVLGWLPPAGRETANLWTVSGMRNHLAYLILPAATLGIGTGAALCRVLRASLLEVLNSDYVRTARAKGLSGRVVLIKHALRNALIPFVTLSGLSIAALLEGSIIVETVFSWPGVGSMMIDAIKSRDAPMALGGVLVIAFIYVFVNLIVDLLYVVIDPRVRLDGGAGK